ncbi:hypothetical protein BY996DRAFT_6464629 [Phakopsora pachyrhizi]|nr:hypothetical protein BY996DRAFT_6464629 [Phakopsora pachyrhizi]
MPVRNRRGKLPKAEQVGLGRVGTAGRAMKKSQGRRRKALCGDISQGRRRKALCGDILQGQQHIAGPTTTDNARGPGGDVRIDNRRADKGKNALWRNKDCSTDKEAVGREEAGGRPEEVSVGLVRRRETPHQKKKRRTDIWGISKAVVGRAVDDCRAGARRRHTEVRSSYHFRVRTEVNSTTF